MLSDFIFVYGTLKTGEANHFWIARTGSTFIGRGHTTNRYPLVELFNLPCVLPRAGFGHHVHGEIYKVSENTLASLDRLEGHPILYKRQLLPVQTSSRTLRAWIYLLHSDNVPDGWTNLDMSETY